jgi:hypothetical protein
MKPPALLVAVLSAALCVGCAETSAPVATSYAAAPRRPGAWQQFCEQAWNVGHASSLAGARGADGWELVAMYNGVLCYKRPAPDAREYRPQQGLPAAPPGQPTVPVVRDPGF